MIFANKGWENTPEAARLACDYAREHGIKHVVIASKTGYTTDIFMDTFAKAGVDVHFVNVTHCYGDLGPGQCEMTPEKRRELTDKGVTVITATHALSGAERGIVNKYGGVTPAILMADTLKMLGQGMKVGVEIYGQRRCSLWRGDPGGRRLRSWRRLCHQPDPRPLQQPL